MASNHQDTVKAILKAWIARKYDLIYPYLANDVIYVVGAGAAKSICHTPGIFIGKDKVKLWYDSHTLVQSVYGEAAVNPFCGFVAPPQVITFEDTTQNIVFALGTVDTGVQGELPCQWMSTWRFEGDLVSRMILLADSVGGLGVFEKAREDVIVKAQAGFVASLGPEPLAP
jgi:hypothetical protein